ncbi:kinetochore-associated protein 1 isoform X3 [Anolis carolinensis]|uniref:kinetochore-associated protein 1 isoform X3 n=1 Tax=Anolis carolinensis TaxID=28377 RepID=UPI0002C89C4F|nr:PREDICTED: kinetochore-associated protein 1 isoform X1 [Anolis carolinensis]XP_008118077.1 PREDICTED: kinetochore-associated protein 1 isoform X2 [Anolis carolinensis]|eukprot:XP_008118075.1 PREDICTED: kinetochore-associated protein 1 isoform X1 [Anolis carolinensis]
MWDLAEFLLSDETRSGTINLHSKEGSLYQLNALLKVASSEKVSSNPELYSCKLRDGCLVVADRAVLLLDDICQSLRLFLQFESEVDVVGLCQEGQFLVIGERSGKLHLIHVSSEQTLLTNVLVQGSSNSRTYFNLILEEDVSDGGTYHAFILTNSGFFCVMHLPLAKTQEAIGKMDISAAKKLQGQVETCFIPTEAYHTMGCLTALTMRVADKFTLIIGGAGDYVMSVWEVNPKNNQISLENVVDSAMIKAVKRLQVVGSFLFVLDSENILSLWDVGWTMIWDGLLVETEEFLLTSESDVSAVARQGIADLKLVVLTKPDGVKQTRRVVIFSLPTLHQLYSLNVSHVSSLVHTGMNTDTIYFLEGAHEDEQESPDVSFLVMRCLTEALPENRLSRLLHKRKFAEAESFAIHFGLDTELVYQVKLNSLLEGLPIESSGDVKASAYLMLVAQAKETLSKIKDSSFVVACCIRTPWPTYEIAQEMLDYAQSRTLKRDDGTPALLLTKDSQLDTEVLRAQRKLVTFCGAFGSEKFSGTAWLEFLHNDDIFRDVLLQLKEGNLSSAQYIWLRHQADFEKSLDVKMLDQLLSTISAMVSRKVLCRWLGDVVIPFVRRFLPEGERRIAKWLEQSARNLELTDKANWPENGLEVAQVFFTSQSQGEVGLASSWHSVPLDEIKSLSDLVAALQGLLDLYRKYNCRLALSDFEKGDANTIVFRMFDKVPAAELIPVTLEKYIGPYICHHHLQKDEILLQYIKDLLQRYSKWSASLFDTMWEAKAIAVLGCMSDIDLIFDGVLAIMHGAVIPWSSGMKLLVEKYLHMDHAKVKLVQEGYQLMEMKTLLRSYGIRDTNLLNDKQMIWMLVKYILKQDSPSCLEDVLKIANAYMLTTSEVYLWRIIDLIDKEKGDDVIDLLKSLPPSEAVEIAERTVTWGKLELEAEMFDSEEERNRQLYLKNTLVDVLKFLLCHQKGNLEKTEEYEAHLKCLKTLKALQANFDICVSPKDYENLSLMTQLLQEKIDSYNAERSQKTQEKTSVENGGVKRQKLAQCGLYRLAGLLRRTEPEMGTELALRALDAGNVEEALNICRDLYEHHHNEQTGKLLFLACRKICHVLASGGPLVVPKRVNLSTAIHEMAVQAVTVCSPDLLSDAMELSKYTSLARELSEKCQIEDTGFIAKETSLGADKDPFTEWTFDEFFTEDGAVLDPSTVLPPLYETASAILTKSKMYPLESTCSAVSPFEQAHNLCTSCMHPVSVLLSKLQEGSQCEFALKLAVISLGSLFQNVTASNVDMSLGAMACEQEAQDAEHKAFLYKMLQSSTSVTKSIVIDLLHKVFNSHPIDHRLALGYCTVLPKEMRFQMLWDLVNKTAQNYSKIQAVGVVGMQLSLLSDMTKEQKEFEDLITDAEWGLELGKLGISFQSVFRMPSVRKKEFLATLVKHPNVETELIKKYCSAYQVDMDAALKFCIEMHFQNVSATGVEGDASGDTGKSPKHGVVLSKALETVPLLNSPASLVDNLSATLYKLDPYDYETIEALLLLIERAGVHTAAVPLNLAQALMLLKHLKSYKRTSVPGALERQYIIGQGMALPPAAQTRLPFHMIFFGASNYFFKIIAAELSEDSFHKLLLMSKLMKVSLNTLYLLAADHLFQQKLKPKILDAMRSECWEAVDKETAKIVQTITSYLHCITNPKWATGLAYKMAEELPPGPMKVQAWEYCIGLSRQWLTSTTLTDELREKAEESLKKLQVQHRHSATEAVLMVHKLNSEEHRKLLGAPGKLIVSLYQHSSIPESFQDPMGRDYPDVHAAAKEIAKINDLDMTTIWNVLLEKWLCPSELPTDKTSGAFGNIQEDEDLKRVIYLLQAHPEDSRLRILHRWTVSEISPVGLNQLSFAHRSRALKCLLYIADPPAVESLFKKPVENVKQFLKCLIYLAEFEVLNIPYTYESFHSTPKEGLVKGLWKNHSHKPMAVKLMTELSLDYQVHDAQLWNGLLQKLMSFQMISHLRKVLREISGICSLWQIPNFSRAWQTVICAPLLSAVPPPSPGQLEACCDSFRLLLMCPLTTHLDLLGIAKQYVQLQLPAFAFGCLLLIPQLEKRSQVIQDLLAKCSLEAMAQQVDEYMSWGEVAGLASQIRHLMLNHGSNVKQEESHGEYAL